ncbi:hypothetical protein BGW38_010223 [Lunasporangiospora selenospora]|uniref:Uncharacterized protein n=1 Tax=Lunasporangiospora selenospora TaxID=979761 RepID=A0A9P6KFL1_9FUNG|nr:hypothetical protein BGW38_010223 [Lunasporangiospora selenospora]
MGVHGHKPWTKKHGYISGNLILGITELPDCGKKRVDLAWGFNPTIRWAYGTKSLDDAHAVVETQLRRIGEKDDVVVYVDGAQAQEKEKTQAERAEKQTKAQIKAETAISGLGQRLSTNQKH